MRPGIVHRLDKETSGLIIVAKNDFAHAKLADEFSGRRVKKTYIALVHGWVKKDHGTISTAMSRDAIRRIRMTTRRTAAAKRSRIMKRNAASNQHLANSLCLKVTIETGRTHQIRVHLVPLGIPLSEMHSTERHGKIVSKSPPAISLSRNFLHAAEISLAILAVARRLSFSVPIPELLDQFLKSLE